MNRRTHIALTKMWAPHIPTNLIDKVSSAIDNPSRAAMAMHDKDMLNVYDVFKLTKFGHRKYNHDIRSAYLAAFMVNPQHALELSFHHLWQDKLSNYMHDAMGIDDKEIFEATFNKFFYSNRKMFNMRPGRKPRKMF